MEPYDYIKDDLAGYPFNAKYPPNYEQNGVHMGTDPVCTYLCSRITTYCELQLNTL
jgi:hypothetical protein